MGKHMDILTFSEARAGLKQVMDDVCADHQPKIITRQRGEHVVLMSLPDYQSTMETLHLLGSSANASRLRESIAQVNKGRTSVRKLLNDGNNEG